MSAYMLHSKHGTVRCRMSQSGMFSSTLLGRKLQQSDSLRAASASMQGSFVFSTSTSLLPGNGVGSRSMDNLRAPAPEVLIPQSNGCALQGLVGALASCGDAATDLDADNQKRNQGPQSQGTHSIRTTAERLQQHMVSLTSKLQW
jgi:hypothetical protein